MCCPCGFIDVGGNKVNKLYCRCKICKQLLRRQQVCNGCNTVGSALPDMYTRCPRASVYISGNARFTVLQLICYTSK